MLPLYVVNNHGQFNHLIQRMLRDMDIPTTMIANDTPPADLARGCRGIILGGGPTLDRTGVAADYLDLGLPVLGICLGLHIIATARGGAVRRGASGGFGAVEVDILEHNDILQGYPDRIPVWASHADEVSVVPEGFVRLAESAICGVEAIASPGERLYGVQWHPEVSHTVNGRLLFENFDRICSE
ncbi:GMP synthase subunit A [Methanoculleus bourgensis]|jgi:GMP synthase (glutamine-hydrolysing)|uniref:GMP synthase [glutamine-hydrolyzing] subunit A n=1 Tax=Methanoculleus bourgensis TaxID=83986 RepID=A0A0X3BM07_9EURY|nr:MULTISPECIES: GMP synthase subunit A [Methanoculleus]MBT0733614.1 GMP synthase subunit A [Methanoculleus bourgensis]MDD3372667.1 GMP synthase subunit A [Methanoculleus bourgensis]NMA89245.1 GMP synthase subunit A [Methanoculleus bourgensis]CVK32594.1 GMP synthase [glutamine-hydrolyzing] subunit A [Methanoculleus bourgensis]SAI88140.1 GMP synthase (glutamine-hydrolysing) [Methanoculleus bourgensis]